MRGIGTSGIATTGGFTGTASASDEENDVEITELEGREKKKTVSRALADRETKSIKKQLLKHGFRPAVSDAKVVKFDKPDKMDPSRLVAIPYVKSGEDEEDERAGLVWSDDEKLVTLGHRFYTSGSSDLGNNLLDAEFVDTYQVKGSDVEIETNNTSVRETRETFTISGCYCETTGIDCDLDNYCLLIVAAAYSTTIAGCGLCYLTPEPTSCALCLADVGIDILSTFGCVRTAECEDITICLDRDEIPDGSEPCEVCNNIRHPMC